MRKFRGQKRISQNELPAVLQWLQVQLGGLETATMLQKSTIDGLQQQYANKQNKWHTYAMHLID